MLNTAVIYRLNKFGSHLDVSLQCVANAQVPEIRPLIAGLKRILQQ